jgi:hypothetical protein
MTLRIENFAEWLACGERGESSNAIVARVTGMPVGNYGVRSTGYPHDPSDFRRCMQLINQYPVLRSKLHQMRDVSAQWMQIVDHWDELEAIYETEHQRADGNAPLLYKRLHELADKAVTGDERGY